MKKYPEKIPDKEAEEIKKLFHYRCGRCGEKKPLSVHEIVPRGAIGKEAMKLENRIPLCTGPGSCHDWAHTVGTFCSVPVLMAWREKRCPTKLKVS
jgi:5-methylcytosine-specific restriction endonuclease McrA